MTKLSPNAKSALEMLQEKHLSYTIAKTTIEQELKRELQQRLSNIRHERDVAIRLAADAGVPKTQLGKTIGTSNYKTIQDILAHTDNLVNIVPSGASGRMTVIPGNTGTEYVVSLSDFGDQSVSGSATIGFTDNDIEWVSGDQFVLAQIYRNNASEELLSQIHNIG